MDDPRSPPSRTPLDGIPERRLSRARNMIQLFRWLGALVVPTLVLPLLAPWAHIWVPSVVRGWVGLGLFLVMFYGTLLAIHGLLLRAHVARRIRRDEEGLWVSRGRIYGTPFTVMDPGAPEDTSTWWRVEFASIQALFRVSLERATPPLIAVGVWYHGGDRVTREMWWYLAPNEAEELAQLLSDATGFEPAEPEHALGGKRRLEAGGET